MQDAFLLALYFGIAGTVSLIYFRLLLPSDELKNRLPNRVSASGILLALVLGAIVFWIWQQEAGFGRFRQYLPIIFNLLIFEAFLILLLRWFRNTFLAVVISLLAAALFWWLQHEHQSVLVYNLTFIIAPLGAAGLLIRAGYWRTKILWLVAGLWTVYDVLASMFIYPVIFRPTETGIPSPSFLFPAVIAGIRTLGSGDFMFLTIFTLALARDFGARAAWAHIGLQVLALFITVLVKSSEVQFPYLTVMTPIFFAVWLWFKKQQSAGHQPAKAAP